MSEVKIVPTAKQKKGSLKNKGCFFWYHIYLLVSDQKQQQMFMCIYIYEYISILILSTCIFLYMHNMYVHVTVITAIRIFRVPQRFSLDLTQSPSYGASPGITHKEKRCQRNKKKWRGIIFFECLD